MQDSVANILKTARRERRITLRALSEKTGKSISFLSEMENGIRPIPKDKRLLNTLAIVLGLSQVALIDAENQKGETRCLR